MTCAHCQKEIEQLARRHGGRVALYCSDKCRSAAWCRANPGRKAAASRRRTHEMLRASRLACRLRATAAWGVPTGMIEALFWWRSRTLMDRRRMAEDISGEKSA